VSAVVRNVASGKEYSVQNKTYFFPLLRNNQYVRKSVLFSAQNFDAMEVCYTYKVKCSSWQLMVKWNTTKSGMFSVVVISANCENASCSPCLNTAPPLTYNNNNNIIFSIGTVSAKTPKTTSNYISCKTPSCTSHLQQQHSNFTTSQLK